MVTAASPDIVTALDETTRDLNPGDSVDLAALAASDPFGAEAFADMARRFGAVKSDGGHWTLERKPRWRPGWLRREHAAGFFDLFETAFGYRMDPRLWAWKYRDTPLPGIGAWKDGRMVAYYGGAPRQVLMFGKPESAIQVSDVMVHPAERGVMTRSGAFLVAAASYLERSIGYGRPHLFAFGFPLTRALALPVKLGLYEQVDQMTELTWPAGAGWSARLLRSERAGEQHHASINRLWRMMAAEFHGGIIGVRDADYVAQRYLRHPTVSYECLLVRKRLTGTPIGLSVMRMVDEELAELVDVIGPRHAFPGLVRIARHWARQQGAARLRAWITASHAHLLSDAAASAVDMGIAVPANIWTPGPKPQDLKEHWWLMAGDTDFR